MLAACGAVAGRPGTLRRERLIAGGAALGARSIAALAVSCWLAVTGRASVTPDERDFLAAAEQVQRGGGTDLGYSRVLGVLFEGTGASAWLPRALNVVAGAMLAVVVVELVGTVASSRAALRAGLAVALWPSLVAWSVLVLKDALVGLALYCAFWAATAVSRGRTDAVVAAVASLAVVLVLRPWAFALAAPALVFGVGVAGFLQRSRAHLAPVVLLGAALAIVGVVGNAGVLGLRFVGESASVAEVERVRSEGSEGATGFADPDVEDLGDVLVGVPPGLIHNGLGPLPWQPASAGGRLVAAVEFPLWIAATICGAAGAWAVARRAARAGAIGIGVFTVSVVAVLAVYEGNAGTAVRQRAMIVPAVVALAAVAVTDGWRRPAQSPG